MSGEPARHKVPWSAAEDQLLREHYPIGGTRAVINAGIERTEFAVYRRAFHLKVTRLQAGADAAVRVLVHLYRPRPPGAVVRPSRPHRITSRLHELAETPGLTEAEYLKRKAQILREGKA